MNIREIDQTYITHTYHRFDPVLTHGNGSLVWDETGREYIDFGAGIAVNTFGYADNAWKEAVINQAGLLQHTSNLYYTGPDARLAQLLCRKTGMSRVFFSNSGAEANECAVKAARLYGAQKLGAEYNTIITLKMSFHGRTIAMLAATGQDVFHADFGPLPGGFVYAEPDDIEDLRRLVKENKCCALMMELVQGEGGVHALSHAYVTEAERICRENNMLLIIDEVQTGNGRTGTLYAYEQYGIKPDIVSTAKGLAGGLPLGATMFAASTADLYTPGKHGSTFGGNPVCCAAALSVLSRLDESFLASVRAKSALLRVALSGAPGIKEISGMGLMIGILPERPAAEVLARAMENGLLVLTAKDRVRLLPPLNTPDELLLKGADILKGALR